MVLGAPLPARLFPRRACSGGQIIAALTHGPHGASRGTDRSGGGVGPPRSMINIPGEKGATVASLSSSVRV